MDDVTLAALVVLLLVGDDLLREAVDDLQQPNLILAVFGELEQPVRSEPDFCVTEMEDVAHSDKATVIISKRRVLQHNRFRSQKLIEQHIAQDRRRRL